VQQGKSVIAVVLLVPIRQEPTEEKRDGSPVPKYLFLDFYKIIALVREKVLETIAGKPVEVLPLLHGLEVLYIVVEELHISFLTSKLVF
jgi:hypothetical protein